MNKNKLIVLLVLLVAVVGLTMGSVAAGSTTKTKYKVVKVSVKSKLTTKKAGKYKVATQKVKIKNSKNYAVLIAFGKKNKAYKANKYQSKVYFKLNGKKYATKWGKGDGKKQKKLTYQYYIVPKKIKVNKIAVKYKK